MEKSKKVFLGVIYLIIGLISLIYGVYYLSETYQTNLEMSFERLVFIISAFVLTGITFYFGIRFLYKSKLL